MSQPRMEHIVTANEVARDAMLAGHHPFGAVLVGPDGDVLLSQGNVDTLNHAETVLCRTAATKWPQEYLWRCTLYTTVEPCCMCAGAIYWANIGNVVYGIDERHLEQYTGAHPENMTMDLPCRDVFSRGKKDIRVVGPVHEHADAIGSLHANFWK